MRRIAADAHQGAQVDAFGLGAERAHGAVLSGNILEGIEVEVLHGIEMGDLVDFIVGNAVQASVENFRRLGPRGVGMRVVAFPGDHVDANFVSVLQPERVVDETGHDLLAEHVAGQFVAEILMGPSLVVPIYVVRALEEIGYPADPALGECKFEVGKFSQDMRPEQITRKVRKAERGVGDHHVDGCVLGCKKHPSPRSDVNRDQGPFVRAGFPEGIPMPIVQAGLADARGILTETHGMASLTRNPAYFFGHQ